MSTPIVNEDTRFIHEKNEHSIKYIDGMFVNQLTARHLNIEMKCSQIY